MSTINPVLDARYVALWGWEYGDGADPLPSAVRLAVEELLGRRNECPDEEIPAIDAELVRLLTPYLAPPAPPFLDDVERALDHMEPETPPSQRYNRIVRIEAADVLELRDPNDGQGGGPADKCRHQYVLGGGQLWRRRLPPETVGDEWRDVPGPVRWERMEQRPPAGSVIDVYALAARDMGVTVVRRERFCSQGPDGDQVSFFIRGEYVSADEAGDVEVLAGPITGAWWEVPLTGLCPECGGDLQWAEAGLVPGSRRCTSCASIFSVGR